MPGKWALSAMVLVASLAAPRTALANTFGIDTCVDAAVGRLRTAAMNETDHDAGLAAAKLYVETLHARGTAKPNPQLDCFDVMEADTPKLHALHCTKAIGKSEEETCVLLDKINFDVARLNAQKLVERADKTSGQAAVPLYDSGGRAYFDSFRTFCEEPMQAGTPLHQGATFCSEVGYNAARAFTAARKPAKTIATYRALIAFDERTKTGSPLAVKALYALGSAYQAVALYEQAAEYFEKYATLHPRGDDADKALIDAVILRLGLGQDALATKDAASFAKSYGLTKRVETAQLALGLALHYGERQAWDKAVTLLTSSMEMLDRGPPDLTTQAHALLARAYANSSTPERSKLEYARVRAVWRDPDAAEKALRRARPTEDEGQKDRRLARALNAVGEAMFAVAEEKRIAEVEPLKLPVFAGPHDRAAVVAYVDTKMRPWFEKKKTAIERSEAEYVKMLDLKPVPPPIWVIAAGAVAGRMWGDFADELRRMPIPDAWRKNRALYGAYYEAVDAMSESVRASHAKPAMKKCVGLAAKYQVSDPRADACAAWLAANYKTEFHVDDEIIPSFRTPGMTTAAPVDPLVAP